VLGAQLCELFGLPADKVRSLELYCRENSPALVRIELLVDAVDITAFSDTTKKYRVAPHHYEARMYVLEEDDAE
jgi:hypothetical protein